MRRRLHTRRVTYEGFARDDGLFDIEAHLTDVKDQDYALLTGVRKAGDPVHEMHVRVTFDAACNIKAIEATTERMPYPGACDRIGPAYARLVGTNLLAGFRKALHDAMGGVKGCTHITELLGYLPTAAVQTLASLRLENEGPGKPFQLDRCHALDTRGPVVHQFYPQWHRG
ncbi:MAG: DUF2889 domain-containing protein [Proteobacteria bacterium]|nr:DUF2889 domain-containing protein [Pseudomonadota bacterium]